MRYIPKIVYTPNSSKLEKTFLKIFLRILKFHLLIFFSNAYFKAVEKIKYINKTQKHLLPIFSNVSTVVESLEFAKLIRIPIVGEQNSQKEQTKLLKIPESTFHLCE